MPLDPKDLLRQFRTGGWVGQAEVETFVHEAGEPDPATMVRLIEVLCDARAAADQAAHRNRCVVFANLAARVIDRELFVPYVRALRKGDAAVRAVVAPLLAKANNVAGHEELVSLINSPEAALRKVAGHAIRQIGGRAVFEALAEIVRAGDGAGVPEAMELLVAVAAHVSIPVLADVLENGKPPERASAARLLGDPQRMARDLRGAIRALENALEDDDERVVVAAVGSLSLLCDEDEYFRLVEPLLASSRLGVVAAGVRGLRCYRSARVIGTLSGKFHEGPNPIRLAVLETCEAMGTEEIVPVLVEALGHKLLAVRQKAGEILTQLARSGKVELARTILWLLRSRDVNVRRLAIDMARAIGDREGALWPKLLRFLRDEDWWVRERATDALVEMAGRELTRHMIAMLQDPSDVIRRYAVDVLARLKDPTAVGALVRVAHGDADWWVRERAIGGLGLAGDERALPHLIDLLAREEHLRLAVIDALVVMKARQAAPHVAALLSEPDAEVRLAALKFLEALGDPSVAEQIRPCLDSVEVRIRDAARGLLARWNLAAATIEGKVERGLSLLDRLLVVVAEREGDDLILSAGRRPYMRKLATTAPLANNLFTHEQMEAMLAPGLSAEQRADLAALRDADFSYEVGGDGYRFRANVFRQSTGLAAVFHRIGSALRDIESLGLPPIVRTFADLKNGLVLVGGPSGSGKSATLAALIDHINGTSARHVITLEDPIEAVHVRRQSLVNQREIGTHARSFHRALRSALREDPDVLLVGEMRDLETIRFAVTAAETGHLVFATMHTISADGSVDRIIDAFPPAEQPQVRTMLADSLRAVLCQYLLPRKDAPGRVLVAEVMTNNDAIANLIRKAKTFQINAVVGTSRDIGMQTMDIDLERLVRDGKIAPEHAYARARDKRIFESFLAEGAGLPAPARPAAGAAPAPGPTRTMASS